MSPSVRIELASGSCNHVGQVTGKYVLNEYIRDCHYLDEAFFGARKNFIELDECTQDILTQHTRFRTQIDKQRYGTVLLVQSINYFMRTKTTISCPL